MVAGNSIALTTSCPNGVPSCTPRRRSAGSAISRPQAEPPRGERTSRRQRWACACTCGETPPLTTTQLSPSHSYLVSSRCNNEAIHMTQLNDAYETVARFPRILIHHHHRMYDAPATSGEILGHTSRACSNNLAMSLLQRRQKRSLDTPRVGAGQEQQRMNHETTS